MIDFKKEVIDKSFEKPVLVDFWAPWCGPCRILGPAIEQIAQEQKETWSLVKINTEEEEAISNQYMIRSIPNVKLFYRGEVIDEFLGALPRQAIQDWLKKALPNPGWIALDHVLDLQEQPSVDELNNLLERFPESPEIRLVLSQLLLWDNPDRTVAVLEPIKMGSPYYDKANYLRSITAFLQLNTEDEDLQAIRKKLNNADLDQAMPDIIKILTSNPKIADGKLAKAAIGIFNTLGTQHPLTKTYRKQLDMALWV